MIVQPSSHRIGIAACLALLASCGSEVSGEVIEGARGAGPSSSSAATIADLPASRVERGVISFEVPAGLVLEAVSSSMRLAQCRLPSAGEEGADGELVIYDFGPGQGGSVESNIGRWKSQMADSDGGTVEAGDGEEPAVTLLDISGTYVAEMRPGSGVRRNDAGSRMLAAVVETTGHAIFVKAVGPKDAMDRWSNSVRSLISSIRWR